MEEFKSFLKSIASDAITYTADKMSTSQSSFPPVVSRLGPLVFPRWHSACVALFVQQSLKGKYRCQLQIQPLKLLSIFSWQFLSHCAISFSFCISETNGTFINLVLKLALGQENKSKKHEEIWAFLDCHHICMVCNRWAGVMWSDSNHGATILWRVSVTGNAFCLHNVFTTWRMKLGFHADWN